MVRNGSGTWPSACPRATGSPRAGCDRKGLRGIDQHVFQQHRPSALPLRYLLLDGNLLLLVPHPPAAMIRRLAQRNAVDPGAQTGLAVKTVDAGKTLKNIWVRSAASAVGTVRASNE